MPCQKWQHIQQVLGVCLILSPVSKSTCRAGAGVRLLNHLSQEKSFTGSAFPQNTNMTEVRVGVPTQVETMNASSH